MINNYFSILFYLLLFVLMVFSTELTFELADNSKECFYEEIKKNTTSTLEYQVVTGGHYDVDVTLEDPKKKIIYNQVKSQFDSHTFTASMTGIYVACFSNEFSTISHKIVYMDFQVGEETPLPGLGDHITALTKMEASTQDIHKALSTIIDFQMHHKLREATGKDRADEMNERVLWWSVIETFVIVLISVSQVIILKNFFTERKPLNINFR